MEGSSEVNEWLDSFSQQHMQIWCEDPETNTEKIAGGVMGMGKTYVTYRIMMKQVGRDVVGVRHRYSEFETLRNSLRDRYGPLGIAVPSLPPKNVMSNIISTNMKQTFISERILGLSIFCEQVIASPWLRNDKLWKDFMKPKTGGASSESPPAASSGFSNPFKRDTASAAPVVYDSDNIGENKLISCLHLLEVPYKFTLTQRMEEVRIEINTIEKFVRVALEKVRAVQTCERAYASAQEAMAEAMNQWLQAENAGVRTMAGKTFDENQNVVQHPYELSSQTLTCSTALFRAKGALYAHYPDYTGLSLAGLLEQELSLVESLKELLRLHDEMVLGIEAVTNKIVKTEASRSANKFEQVAEQRIILEERQASLTAFYKGFIYFTLPCSARQRAASLRKFSAFAAAAHLTSAYALQVACVQFFTDISMRPTGAIAEASRTFELMRVKQLQLIPEHVSAGMTSPSLSPNNSSSSLNLVESTAALALSATGPASPGSGSSERGTVALCADSTGITGLFQRAQSIGQQGKGPALESSPRKIIGAPVIASAAPAPNSEGGGNPLARRGSAVMKHQQQQQQQQPSAPSTEGGSSLMAEVPDEMLSAYNIRPSEDTPPPMPAPVPSRAGPARADPFSAHRLSPMKPSEKSQSLMADLMGGGDAGAAAAAPAKSSSVWEDV